jgi:hypothetical protein
MLSGILLLLAAAAPQPCDLKSSVHVTVGQIAMEADDFIGRCVAIVGYSDGRSLFDRPDILREHLRLKSMKRSGIRFGDQMIGVYDLPNLPAELRQRESDVGLKWRLIGRVDTCAEMQRRAKAEADAHPTKGMILIVMPAGHCHYLRGPALRVAQAQVLPESR